MNAYEVIDTLVKGSPMDDRIFYGLVHDFKTGWLNQENYMEQLELHRQPLVLKKEILRKLYDYFRDIQQRPEMRSPDLERKGSSYIPSVVREIRIRDKRIGSLYEAILAYCQWSKADLLPIAVHMAECQAIDELIAQFQQETMGYNQRESTNSFFRFAEEYEALKKKFMIEVPVTRAEAERQPRLTEGQLIRCNPDIPDDPVRALELFKNYYARVQFFYQKDNFFNKYRKENESSVTAEIQAIEQWITDARKLSYAEVCDRNDFTNEQHEFLRLENGYYEGYRMSWHQCNENSTAARVYGRYIHFLKYLQEQMFDFIAARSNYKDADGNVILEKLKLPEVQMRIEQETRGRIATLPLEDQYYYYKALLNTSITYKRDYLASGGLDKDRIVVFDAEIEYAKMELGRIERARASDTTVPEKNNKREAGPRSKPTFKEAVWGQGFDILKHYFPADQQPELQQILKTGDDAPTKLHFRGNGKRLLDFFKRLRKGQLVISVNKSDLQAWIIRNFTFGEESDPKSFRAAYAERVLSGADEAAKGKRLIDVRFEGGVWTLYQPPITNRAEPIK